MKKETPKRCGDLETLSRELHDVLRQVLEHPELAERVPPNEPLLFASEVMNGHAIVVIVRPSRPLNVLTPRELDIARLVGRGLGDQGIAKKLNLSSYTVKAHLRSIYRKLNIHTRASLARFFSGETV